MIYLELPTEWSPWCLTKCENNIRRILRLSDRQGNYSHFDDSTKQGYGFQGKKIPKTTNEFCEYWFQCEVSVAQLL